MSTQYPPGIKIAVGVDFVEERHAGGALPAQIMHMNATGTIAPIADDGTSGAPTVEPPLASALQ